MSILGHVKVPSGDDPHSMHAAASGQASKVTTADNFDSYLTKLQSICTETMTNEEVKPISSSSGVTGGSQIKP